MKKEDFIKVTPNGSKEVFYIPETNRAFYAQQDAKIEELTEDEFIQNCLPAQKQTAKKEVKTANDNFQVLTSELISAQEQSTFLMKELNDCRVLIESLQKENEVMKKTLQKQEKEIGSLEEKLVKAKNKK